MADAAAAAPAATEKKEVKKPERPNEALFKENLAQAEKEYQDSMAKYVRRSASACFG